MNPVFQSPVFWETYLTLDPRDESAEELAAQRVSLSADFQVHEGSREMETEDYVVEFVFACGDRYSIVVEYAPAACSKEIYLADASSCETHLMGWYDLVRWHPYCLRTEELDALLEFWRRRDPRWPTPHVPFLLLCQFVGLADPAAADALTSRGDAAWRALGMPPPKTGEPAVALHVPEPEDYRWELDQQLGWVFTSDEYCCYSIRNRAHVDGEEGRFPFKKFREMIEHVRSPA